MRLCKLNCNPRVKSSHRRLFCAEEVASGEGHCVRAHWVTAHCPSPCQGRRRCTPHLLGSTRFIHSYLSLFFLSTFHVSDACSSGNSKRLSCLSKITLLPNGRTDSKLSEPLIRDPSSLSLCTCSLRDRILPRGLEYLLYGDDCGVTCPVQTSPLTSPFLFPAASRWPPLGGLGGPSNLASPRPDSWWLPTQSAFCLSLPHLRKWQHRFSLEPWKRPVTSHLTQDKETKAFQWPAWPYMTHPCLPLIPSAPAALPSWSQMDQERASLGPWHLVVPSPGCSPSGGVCCVWSPVSHLRTSHMTGLRINHWI